MRGGVKFYRGAPRAARAYVERDRARADDYYLAEGSGVASRIEAAPGSRSGSVSVTWVGEMDGEVYERWVAGYDVDTGQPKGRLRTDDNALRFVEVVVNGPKTWSLAAALHPEVSAALDEAQDRAAEQIIGWVAAHATTRVGPRGRQVQVPAERISAAVVRHQTSRAGDPHRHLHLQVNARVFAAGRWRGLHSVGIRDSIEAMNGIGHAAVVTDPVFRLVLAKHGFTLDPTSGEIRELSSYVGQTSARAAQIHSNLDRYEAEWRTANPGREPGPRLLRAWDRRAWAQARPDKVVPVSGADLEAGWVADLRAAGYRDPRYPVALHAPDVVLALNGDPVTVGRINRPAAAEWAISVVGAKRSAWNAADLRGAVETLLTRLDLITAAPVRTELAEDITARAVARCVPLLARDDVPEHIRALTSRAVREVEEDILGRLTRRARDPARRLRLPIVLRDRLDEDQARAVAALAGDGQLLTVEGAAGAGKTTTLAATRHLLARQHRRLLVVTPTRKAADVAARETGAEGHSAAWLAYQHGWRWDRDGRWSRPQPPGDQAGEWSGERSGERSGEAQLQPGDLLVVDEAGMLDQDTARALLAIADESGARVAFMGDRHQLPAVGRGGVLEHAITWSHPTARVDLDRVHRFNDPSYAALSLTMRSGARAGEVFDTLVARNQIRIHPSEPERHQALADLAAATGDLVIANRRDQVAALNASIRERLHPAVGDPAEQAGDDRATVTTAHGETLTCGDRVATRRNAPVLGVANRQTWTITTIADDGSLTVHSTDPHDRRARRLPRDYAEEHVELAYATTVHGAQGDTVPAAHLVHTDTTSAAAAYVAMTRGRETNTAHLVATNLEDARQQWVDTFSRDRADLGPAHLQRQALEDIDRYGPTAPRRPAHLDPRHGYPRQAAPTPGGLSR